MVRRAAEDERQRRTEAVYMPVRRFFRLYRVRWNC